jgi:hypothetical protein
LVHAWHPNVIQQYDINDFFALVIEFFKKNWSLQQITQHVVWAFSTFISKLSLTPKNAQLIYFY